VVVVVNVGKVAQPQPAEPGAQPGEAVRQQRGVSAADRPDQLRLPVPPVGLRLRQECLMTFMSERRIDMGAYHGIASSWLISPAPLCRSVQSHGEGAAAHQWPPRIPATAATDSGDGATDSGLGGRIRSSGVRLDRPFYTHDMRRGILERDAELSALAHAAREAADRHGSVVLVMGEAGIGKSSLVEALRSHLPAEGRMLIGYCDDLATPRTLGPFRDLVGSVGTELSRAVTDGSERDRVLTALRTELTWPDHPTVLVIEDIHWADDATLDALRFLIRRIADLPAVLVLTYRDDELNREHPLHGLLGQASRSDHVRRLPLRRLSQQAVR